MYCTNKASSISANLSTTQTRMPIAPNRVRLSRRLAGCTAQAWIWPRATSLVSIQSNRIWPAIDAIKSNKGLSAWLNQSFAKGDGAVFSFGSSADYKNAKLQIGFTFQSGLGLPTPAYYSDPKDKEVRADYVKFMAKLFELTGTPPKQAAHQADLAMKLETDLAKHSVPRVEMRKPENQYHFVSVAAADKITPHFDWNEFFKAQGVTIDKGFSLSQPKFFAEFDHLLATAPLDEWKAYLKFHTISSAANALSDAFVDAHFNFYGKTLRGQPEQKEQWKRSLGAVNGAMGQALGQLYVAKYFPPEAKARAKTLVQNVRDALKTRIENLDWMSAETKKKAIEKWSLFLPKIGYPDKWRSWDGLKITPDNYYANMEAASKFNYDYDIAKIGKPTDRLDWGMTPQTVNAYYNPTDNTINFPAAILQPPFFYANGDDAINYGGIGAVIGHESSHGFDDQGSQFDGNGNLENWWTAEGQEEVRGTHRSPGQAIRWLRAAGRSSGSARQRQTDPGREHRRSGRYQYRLRCLANGVEE